MHGGQLGGRQPGGVGAGLLHHGHGGRLAVVHGSRVVVSVVVLVVVHVLDRCAPTH